VLRLPQFTQNLPLLIALAQQQQQQRAAAAPAS
jgi:hypothetical protein